MSKAKARQRAKAKTGQKAKNHAGGTGPSGQKDQSGRFDPEASSIKGPGGNANTKNFAGANRRAARSR